MSLSGASISVTRIQVSGLKKNTGLNGLSECLKPFQAKGIKLQGTQKPEICGWVRPISMDDLALTDKDEWDLTNCQASNGVTLRMRIERRRLNSSLVQNVIKEALAKRMARRTNPLTRAERKETIEQAKEELMQMCLPAIFHVDGYWNFEREELWIFTTNKRAVSRFTELFRDSFVKTLSLDLMPLELPKVSLRGRSGKSDLLASGSDEILQRISLTEPMSFVEHGR
jgi:hypothetical protein